jgi:hypothetical protein
MRIYDYIVVGRRSRRLGRGEPAYTPSNHLNIP